MRTTQVPQEALEACRHFEDLARQQVKDLMALDGVSHADLAHRLGYASAASVTHMLNRPKSNPDNRVQKRGTLTLRSYSVMLWALGYEFGDSMFDLKKVR